MTATDDLAFTFHIGAHKTATTHLQRSLEHASEALIAAGVRYYGPSYFRLPGRTINRLFGLKSRFAKELRRSPPDQFALMQKDARRVLFSEENYAGALIQSRPNVLIKRYPDAGARIARLCSATGVNQVDLCLSIRHPATFLNSGYGQYLLGGNILPPETYLRYHPLDDIHWVDLVQQLVEVDAVRHLTVWRYEDYGALFKDICAALVGPDAAPLITPFKQRSHVGLSAAAVAAIHDAYDGRNGDGLAGRFRKTYPVSDAHPAFDQFDAETHARVGTLYDAQCAQIAALPKVRFLRPAD